MSTTSVPSRPFTGYARFPPQYSAEFMVSHRIEIDEAPQVHFGLEGVQTYGQDEIRALKSKEDRLMSVKEGVYVKPKVWGTGEGENLSLTITEDNRTKQDPKVALAQLWWGKKLENSSEDTQRSGVFKTTFEKKTVKKTASQLKEQLLEVKKPYANAQMRMAQQKQQKVKVEKAKTHKQELEQMIRKMKKEKKEKFQSNLSKGMNAATIKQIYTEDAVKKGKQIDDLDWQMEMNEGEQHCPEDNKASHNLSETNDSFEDIELPEDDENQDQMKKEDQKASPFARSRQRYDIKLSQAILGIFGNQ